MCPDILNIMGCPRHAPLQEILLEAQSNAIKLTNLSSIPVITTITLLTEILIQSKKQMNIWKVTTRQQTIRLTTKYEESKQIDNKSHATIVIDPAIERATAGTTRNIAIITLNNQHSGKLMTSLSVGIVALIIIIVFLIWYVQRSTVGNITIALLYYYNILQNKTAFR
jgi:hypothetical protein